MQMPKIGLGTFRLKEQVVIDSVLNGLELGYRHIDTAQIYGNEAEVGRAIKESGIPRSELYITTKIWTSNFSGNQLQTSLQESLEKLQIERLDMTLIHWPSPKDEVPVAEYMTALANAQEQGLTQEMGVSNFTIAHLRQAIAAVGAGRITNQQIEIHPFLQNKRVVAFCQEHQIPVTAYMPLAYGKVMHDPLLQKIAGNHATTPALISLAWLLQQGFAVIPSSTKREHLANNLKAANITLSDEEMSAIARLDINERIANPDFSPNWD